MSEQHKPAHVDSQPSDQLRKCKQCGDQKPLDEFPPYQAGGISGRRHVCRICWNAKWTPIVVKHNKRYYHENIGGYRDKAKQKTAVQHEAERETHHRRNQEYKKRHPKKHRAKVVIMMAVRSGRLVRKPCEVCGLAKSQAHHDDYDRPLDVIWLCSFHHGERHRLLNRHTVSEQWPEQWPNRLRVG